MILASMLAMVMLAASPALAQTQSSEQNASGTNINQLTQQCQNVIGDINVAGGDNIAVSQYGDIAQENNTNVTVVQNCFQAAAQANINIEDVEAPQAPAPDDDQYEAPAPAPDDDQYEAPADDQYVAPEGDDDAAAGAGAAAPAGGAAEGGAVAVLPDTGGASLFTLGAGALLVAGGLLARKIVR